MDQKIEPLTPKEEQWVAMQLENAARIVEEFSPSDAKLPLTLEGLDRAFAAWVGSKPSDVGMINAIINCIGVAFGRFLVDGAGFKWVIASDKHGSDLAVYALPGTGDVLVYPTNFVAKRWERRETHFLQQSYQRITADLKSIELQYATRKK